MSSIIIEVCDLDDLKKKKSITRYYEDLKDEVTTYLKYGAFTSFSTVCPHMGGYVSLVDDVSEIKRCKWHGREFSKGGEVLNSKAKICLTHYETYVRGDKVFISYDR